MPLDSKNGAAGGVLAAALDLAARGIPVFPCKDDKAPDCEGGFHAASTNPDQIRIWFSEPRLIGVPTGAKAGGVCWT